MPAPDGIFLSPPQRIAVAYTPPPAREPLVALLALDSHLGRLVAGSSEPMLGQIRLAWWREELAKPPEARARGNPELEMVGTWWPSGEEALVGLVDGWEHLLGGAPLPAEAIAGFAAGRGGGFAAFAGLAGRRRWSSEAALAGRRWALADLAERVSDAREREDCRSLFAASGRPPRLPRVLRGLTVLEGLATRSMARREPLMAGRGGALAALRLGLLGR